MYTKKLMISLTPQLFHLLKIEKEKTGGSYSEIIRRLIEKYLCQLPQLKQGACSSSFRAVSRLQARTEVHQVD